MALFIPGHKKFNSPMINAERITHIRQLRQNMCRIFFSEQDSGLDVELSMDELIALIEAAQHKSAAQND